jgi:hypothetical protein
MSGLPLAGNVETTVPLAGEIRAQSREILIGVIRTAELPQFALINRPFSRHLLHGAAYILRPG